MQKECQSTGLIFAKYKQLGEHLSNMRTFPRYNGVLRDK